MKLGDKVKVTTHLSQFNGRVGVIEKVSRVNLHGADGWWVQLENERLMFFGTHELQVI